MKNIFVYGELEYKTRDINITNVALMSGERLIIRSDSLPKGISIENYGYDELFPKEVVKNLDNWYLEITYSNSKETKTEKLELNNNYLMKKQEVQPIASLGFANNIVVLLSAIEFGLCVYFCDKVANTSIYKNVKTFIANL